MSDLEDEESVVIQNDDNVLDIVDKFNTLLREFNLKIVDDDLEHDGFCIFTVKVDGE